MAVMPVDFTSALLQYGPLGLICGWLMWREAKQSDRAFKQEERREARHEETQREIRLQRQSLDDLVRMMGLEVLSRPLVASRAAQDAQQIMDAVAARKSGDENARRSESPNR